MYSPLLEIYLAVEEEQEDEGKEAIDDEVAVSEIDLDIHRVQSQG